MKNDDLTPHHFLRGPITLFAVAISSLLFTGWGLNHGGFTTGGPAFSKIALNLGYKPSR